jgi:uncharacterized protein
MPPRTLQPPGQVAIWRAARLRRGCWAATAALLLAIATAPGTAQTHSFGWKATKGAGVVYLVGSVHLLSKDFYPLSPALESAYKDSSLLVEEVDMGEMLSADAQMRLLSRGMLPAGQSLDKVVSAPTHAAVTKKLSELGVPIAPLELLKPWMAALTLDALEWQKAGFDPDLGLDKHFYDSARTDSKPVQGLETLQYQLSIFDDMTMDQQDHMLSETLKELDTEQASVLTMANAWKAGDMAEMERIVLPDLRGDPMMYQRLLVARNTAWLPKIEALFARPQPSLVVVGAAHLIGPDGLLQMLRAKGYSVVQQ